MLDHVACCEPACYERACATCMSCGRKGCPAHVKTHLIGGVAYMELCGACAAVWMRRCESWSLSRKAAQPAGARGDGALA
jgi:hypothetical protein